MGNASSHGSGLPPTLCAAVSQPFGDFQSSSLDPLIRALLDQYGDSVQALLFYGSCLRDGDATNGLVDLYVLVDNYGQAYQSTWQAWINAILPPNVFYVALPEEAGGIRAKYAVLSMRDFHKGTSMHWFHSYFWGRFCQPTHVVFVKNDQVAEQVRCALAQAVVTFLTRVLPMLPSECDCPMIWQRGLSLSYRAELRAERPGTIATLFERSVDYFEHVTREAVPAVPFTVTRDPASQRYQVRLSSGARRVCRMGWAVRTVQGKMLSLLRLIKGLLTFKGGVDYILWKIQRHSGVTVEVTPRLRRHPLLAGWVVFWRLYRKGAFR